MDRTKCKILVELFKPVMKKFAEENNLIYINTSASFGSTDVSFKPQFAESVKEDSSVVTDEFLKAGFAPPGTICWRYYHAEDDYFLCSIVTSRRQKYAFKWCDEDPEGIFISDFKGFHMHHPKTGAPAYAK